MFINRRKFVEALGFGALGTAFPASIQRALALPGNHRSGSINDVEHIVILMQENRSFDHYFGAMRGVRGFADPRAVTLPSGQSVWHQAEAGNTVLPFRPDAPELGMQFLEDLPHGWIDTQGAWNGGKYDQWLRFKGATTMAYLTREDIPYHYALADAFTVCDAYYCSFMGSTDPNRYHMWTGFTGNDGLGGGPVVDNSEAGYDWTTFPERLLQAGISWKIYQDAGAGLDGPHYWGWGPNPYIGNYGDNSLLYFHQYQNALPGSPLHEAAFAATNMSTGGTLFDQFRQDVASGTLPRVSWIVAPEAYTEHPNWPANYGAWYISQILDALTANPEVWSKTAFFLMYDENDGFFNHMVPPTPPQSRAGGLSTVDTVNEVFPGNARYPSGPYGLGMRVPMIVISPWTKGGWVNSQVFDHTSLIRFIERRFSSECGGLREPNITPWRRAVVGDLTSAFDFHKPDTTVVSLPSTISYEPPDAEVYPDYRPVPPAVGTLPKQEPGVRPARALPYELDVVGKLEAQDGSLQLRFGNSGLAAAVFQVRSGEGDAGPWTYTVGAHEHTRDSWALKANGQHFYDLAVHGPNGFFRSFKGALGRRAANLAVRCFYDGPGLTLEIKNQGSVLSRFSISDAYNAHSDSHVLTPGRTWVWHWCLDASHGWYDLTIRVDSDAAFERKLAGHVEDGRPSTSDPALGAG